MLNIGAKCLEKEDVAMLSHYFRFFIFYFLASSKCIFPSSLPVSHYWFPLIRGYENQFAEIFTLAPCGQSISVSTMSAFNAAEDALLLHAAQLKSKNRVKKKNRGRSHDVKKKSFYIEQMLIFFFFQASRNPSDDTFCGTSAKLSQ